MTQAAQGLPEPTPKQTAFLKALDITGGRFRARLTASDYQIFDRATLDAAAFKQYRDSVTQDVPKDLLVEVDKLLSQARSLAGDDKPKIKKAVRKLVQADTACRAIANGHFESITLDQARLRIEQLERDAASVEASIGQAERAAKRLLLAVNEFPRLTSLAGPQEVGPFIDRLGHSETYWRSKMASVRGDIDSACKTIEAASFPQALVQLRTELRILSERLGKNVSGFAPRADQVEARLQRGGKMVAASVLRSWTLRKELELDTAIALISSTQAREPQAPRPRDVQSSRLRVALGSARNRGAIGPARQVDAVRMIEFQRHDLR